MLLQAVATSVVNVILVLSPHLDDAAFSVGPFLAKFSNRARIIVATAFTKSELNPSDFALACQLDKGLSAETDYMAIRRKEDIEWSRRIGAEVVHGPFAEAPHRGYQSAKELFGSVLESDKLKYSLTSWLKDLDLIFNPKIILCPIGVGNHVDHLWIHKVARHSFDSKLPLLFFKDQPYSSKLDSFHTEDYFINGNTWEKIKVPYSKNSVNIAKVAAEAYQTQIPFQFGDIDRMKNMLGKVWGQSLFLFHNHALSELDSIFITT